MRDVHWCVTVDYQQLYNKPSYSRIVVYNHPFEQSTANSNSFKIAQKTAFEAKERLYTTRKVIRRLFIIDLLTQFAIYG